MNLSLDICKDILMEKDIVVDFFTSNNREAEYPLAKKQTNKKKARNKSKIL